MQPKTKFIYWFKKNAFAILVLIAIPVSIGIAQDESQEQPQGIAATNLEAAQQLSAMSGRPIFAIAGRST